MPVPKRDAVPAFGDIFRWVAASKSLRDFVYEASCGQNNWFVDDMDDLERRLAHRAAA
jgi:hypothetical protein